MATDHDLYELDSEAPEGWAPVHAWRALGQLRADAAVNPLLQHAIKYYDHEGWWEWMAMEFPRVFAQIGDAILPTLAAWVSDQTQAEWMRALPIEALERLAKRSRDSTGSIRQQCVEILSENLTQFADNDPIVNASLIGTLAKLGVMEAVPLMEQAFAAGSVDEKLFGDWDEIQVILGLKSRAEVPRKPIDPQFLQYLKALERQSFVPTGFGKPALESSKSNRKTKLKQQSESRRKNRKKK
ncbi:hypothetical protein ACQ4M5_39360 [Leptolyngbya sp. AN10]